MPAFSMNTPYACATSPCGQKSDSSGKSKPCASDQAFSAYGWSDGDRQDLDVVVLEVGEVVAHRAQLARADAGEGEGVEHQQHGAVAAERRERDLLVVLVLQGEVGGLGSHLGGHGDVHCVVRA